MADSPAGKDSSSSRPYALASINSPPQSPPPRRQKRSSQSSITFVEDTPLQTSPPTINPFDFEDSDRPLGLGISARSPSISRVPVGSRSPQSPSPKTSSNPSSPYTPAAHSNPFLSPRPDQQNTYPYDSGLPPLLEEELDPATGKNTPHQDGFRGRISSDRSRGGNVTRETSRGDATPSVRESLREDNGKPAHPGCPPTRNIYSSRKNWLSISILILSIYSTIFSGIYLVIAIKQPRYGKAIMSGGKLTPETASVLFALFAKTIELSFVTVFVAFLGQVLSRRSFITKSRGVTIAELTMRNWVIQPGVMITHFETLKHAGLTFLGLLTLTNAFVAMFYTTASDSLVSPHLKFGHWKGQEMVGLVKASYAVPDHVSSLCSNPTLKMDPVYAGTTCLSVLHAGQAHSNHITFLDDWVRLSAAGQIDQTRRPEAPAMLHDNTTVTGSWIEKRWSDMSHLYGQFGRVIDNVTMAMPHAGVFAAARHPKNEIIQPENLAGVGEYRIRASVISPAVNVLCVNMNETELSPLVYVTWPNANITTGEQIAGQRLPRPGFDWTADAKPKPGKKFMNSTIVDDIFEWGAFYQHQPPAFPMFPIEYNSILNASLDYSYTDSIYVLFKAPDFITKDYTLCKLRSAITTSCSTHYNVSGTTGGQMRSNCEDPDDEVAYRRSVPDAPTSLWQKDWINVGSELIRALALGTGISNGNAASSRLITQLVTKESETGPPTRNATMPSLSESLAVMAGSTLLLASTDATFYHFWEHQNVTLSEPILYPFNASIQSQEYSSGFVQRWTIIFYLILIIVFITNCFCLGYFFLRSGLVTDYSEPQNLFALAVNSPPSDRLHGSCGAGPEGAQFNIDWHVMQDDPSGHFFIKEGDRDEALTRRSVRRRMGNRGQSDYESASLTPASIGPGDSPSTPSPSQLRSVKSYSKLSSRRTSWL